MTGRAVDLSTWQRADQFRFFRTYQKPHYAVTSRINVTRLLTELKPRADGGWDVITEKGTIHAEHVVNCGGLWAREIGRMAAEKLIGLSDDSSEDEGHPRKAAPTTSPALVVRDSTGPAPRS